MSGGGLRLSGTPAPRTRRARQRQRVDPDDIDIDIGRPVIYDEDPDIDEPIQVQVGRARIDPPPTRRRGRVRGDVDVGPIEVIREEEGGRSVATDDGRIIELDPVDIDVPVPRPAPVVQPARDERAERRRRWRDATAYTNPISAVMHLTGADEWLDERLAGAADEATRDPGAALGNALLRAGQGGTLGFSDDIATGLTAGADYLRDAASGEDPDWDASLDYARGLIDNPTEELQRRAPNAGDLGDVAGSLPLIVGGPVVGLRGAGLARGALRGGLTGATYSGLETLGRSDEDTLEGRAQEAFYPEVEDDLSTPEDESQSVASRLMASPVVRGGAVGAALGLVPPAVDAYARRRQRIAGARAQHFRDRLASQGQQHRPSDDIADEMVGSESGPSALLPDDIDEPIATQRPTAGPVDDAGTRGQRPAPRPRTPGADEATVAQRPRVQPPPTDIVDDIDAPIQPPADVINESAAAQRRARLMAPLSEPVSGERGLGLQTEDMLAGGSLNPDIQRARAAGVTTIPQAQRVERLPGGPRRLSQIMHDTGVLERGRVDRSSNIAARAAAARERAGQLVGTIEREAASRGASVDAAPVIRELRETGRAMLASGNDAQRAAGRNLLRRSAAIEGVALQNGGRLPLNYALAEIRTEDRIAAQWGRAPQATITPAIANSRTVRRALRRGVNRAVEAVDPQLASDYAVARERMQYLSTIAPRGVPRERLVEYHRPASLSDYVSMGPGATTGAAIGATVGGAPGAAVGGVAGATVAGAANRYWRSVEGSALARMIEGAPVSEAQMGRLISRYEAIAQVDPAAFGPLAEAAVMAAMRGRAAFAQFITDTASTEGGLDALDQAAAAFDPDAGLMDDSEDDGGGSPNFNPDEGL